MRLTVQRTRKTETGIFGKLTVDTNPFTCYTVENLDRSIPAGIYKMDFTWSQRFKKTMPHIIVPVRDELAGGDAGIRIHPANFPGELAGCVAVGEVEDVDAVYNSRKAFESLTNIIMGRTDIDIEVKEIPNEIVQDTATDCLTVACL